jgi:hypothetical protein
VPQRFCATSFMCLLLAIAPVAAVWADSPPKEKPRDVQATLVANGLLNSREQLRTASGTISVKGPAETAEYHIVFDNKLGRIRQDRYEGGECTHRMIRTPTELTLYSLKAGVVEKRPPTDKVPVDAFLPFDVRTFGVGLVSQMQNRNDFFAIRQALEKGSKLDVERDEDALWRAEFSREKQFKTPDGGVAQSRLVTLITVDDKLGFTARRIKGFTQLKLKGDKDWRPATLDQEVVIEWKEVAPGVYAPSSINANRLKPKLSYEYAMIWDKVNEPVKEDAFSIKDLDIAARAIITVVRPDQPPVIERPSIPPEDVRRK